jgi:hypothetical protein
MTMTTHKRSTHIDAPVETVFDYVKDPHNFFGAFDEEWRRHMALGEVKITPEGVGSTFRMMGRMLLLFHMEWVLTREQYVPNELIVDRASTGGGFTYTFEPADPSGTTLSLAFGGFNVPLVGEMIDRVSWNGDRDLDLVLANLKKAIES